MLGIFYGTRPEYIKLQVIIKKLKESNFPCKVVYVTQHDTLMPKDMYYDEILTLGSNLPNRLNNIVVDVLSSNALEGLTRVVVQGDTTTAAAVAQSAYNQGIEVIHIEAGLRTYDMENPYPEEFNRQLISKAASVHFTPTLHASMNLIKEGITKNVYNVGNTVFDSLPDIKVDKPSYPFVLITMHRRENHESLMNWFSAFKNLFNNGFYCSAKFISHPNPQVQKNLRFLQMMGYQTQGIEIIGPQSREDFLTLVKRCSFIITDSGGLQEEAAFYRKFCYVCRKVTERPEGLGVFSKLIKSPNEVFDIQDNQPLIPKNASNPYCVKVGYASDSIFRYLIS